MWFSGISVYDCSWETLAVFESFDLIGEVDICLATDQLTYLCMAGFITFSPDFR